jgi:hypothetical protein
LIKAIIIWAELRPVDEIGSLIRGHLIAIGTGYFGAAVWEFRLRWEEKISDPHPNSGMRESRSTMGALQYPTCHLAPVTKVLRAGDLTIQRNIYLGGIRSSIDPER